jgi:hypothetical protein
MLLVAMYLLPALWLAANRVAIRWLDIQLLLAAGAIFLISNAFSFINELRMLMPATTLVVLVAAIVEARVSGRLTDVGRPGVGPASAPSRPVLAAARSAVQSGAPAP